MKLLLAVLSLCLPLSAYAADAFPVRPDPSLTPGSLCEKPDSKRYPEGIPYCSRAVKSDVKHDVMQAYDARLGFAVTQMNRSDFKIDHYIPLCAGGSNNPDNLWPQHKTVYAVTDPVEPLVCDKMGKGKLRQAEAVELVKKAKANLGEVPGVLKYLQGL